MGNLDHKDGAPIDVLEAILPVIAEWRPWASDGNYIRMELFGRTFFGRPAVSPNPQVSPILVCRRIPWFTKFHCR
jgi:hypothetical protein